MDSNETNEKIQKLKVQIEYYLSDENLQHDKFFHDKITSDERVRLTIYFEGYVDIDSLLNCNKIKTSGATKEQIIEATEQSPLLELSDSKNNIRRKDNKALPELKLLNKKRKSDKAEESGDKEKSRQNEKAYDP